MYTSRKRHFWHFDTWTHRNILNAIHGGFHIHKSIIGLQIVRLWHYSQTQFQGFNTYPYTTLENTGSNSRKCLSTTAHYEVHSFNKSSKLCDAIKHLSRDKTLLLWSHQQTLIYNAMIHCWCCISSSCGSFISSFDFLLLSVSSRKVPDKRTKTNKPK